MCNRELQENFNVYFSGVFTTIIHKIFETKSYSHVKLSTLGNVRFLFFHEFFASTYKLFISEGGMSTSQ